MVGAFVGVAALNCTIGGVWVPDGTRTAVQIIAGAFVGCSMERSDLTRLKEIGKPVAVMLGACLILMLAAGACIAATSQLDLRTALMCAVPGGINDTPHRGCRHGRRRARCCNDLLSADSKRDLLCDRRMTANCGSLAAARGRGRRRGTEVARKEPQKRAKREKVSVPFSRGFGRRRRGGAL